MEEQLMSLKVGFAFKELMNNEKVKKGFIVAVLNIPVETIKVLDKGTIKQLKIQGPTLI